MELKYSMYHLFEDLISLTIKTRPFWIGITKSKHLLMDYTSQIAIMKFQIPCESQTYCHEVTLSPKLKG